MAQSPTDSEPRGSIKVVTIDAENREDVRRIVVRTPHFVEDLIGKPGWKAVGGRLDAIQPDKTTYDTYLDEEALDEWIRAGE